jgi:hypothetical protein
MHKGARTDLCGGRGATHVPTATGVVESASGAALAEVNRTYQDAAKPTLMTSSGNIPCSRGSEFEVQSLILEGCAADNSLPSLRPHPIMVPSERARLPRPPQRGR